MTMTHLQSGLKESLLVLPLYSTKSGSNVMTVTAATVRLWHADADDSDNTCQGTCPQGDSHSQTEGNSHSYGQYLLCCFTFILLFELPTLEWEGLMTQALLWRDQLLVNRSSLLLMSSLILFLIISSQTTSSPPPPSSLLPHTLPPAWTPQAWWWWPPCCSVLTPPLLN